MKKISLLWIGLLGVIALCMTACSRDDASDDIPGKGFHFDEVQFLLEWELWDKKNIENYNFILEGELPHSLFTKEVLMFDYKVKVDVRQGALFSFEYIGDVPHDYDGSIIEPEFKSISDLYKKVYDRAQWEKEQWAQDPNPRHLISTTLDLKYCDVLHFITFYEPVTRTKPGVIRDTRDHAVKVSEFTVLDEE